MREGGKEEEPEEQAEEKEEEKEKKKAVQTQFEWEVGKHVATAATMTHDYQASSSTTVPALLLYLSIADLARPAQAYLSWGATCCCSACLPAAVAKHIITYSQALGRLRRCCCCLFGHVQLVVIVAAAAAAVLRHEPLCMRMINEIMFLLMCWAAAGGSSRGCDCACGSLVRRLIAFPVMGHR